MRSQTSCITKCSITGLQVSIVPSEGWQRFKLLMATMGRKTKSILYIYILYDNSSCLLHIGSLPCRSIDYAIRILVNESFEEYSIFEFFIQDRVYVLENPVQFIQPRSDRWIVINTVGYVSSIIRCEKNRSAALLVGSDADKSTTHNIAISNLEFQYCGADFQAVVMLWNSNNITFTNCAFRNNARAGINAIDSSVNIEDCMFINNTVVQQKQSTDRTPSTVAGGAGFVFQRRVKLFLVIKNTEFISNAAVVNKSEHFIPPYSVRLGLDLVGGGVLVAFTAEAKHCGALIKNTNFTNNEATFGGGLFACTTEAASNNKLVVQNSNFVNNSAGQAGGGMSLSVRDATFENTVIIKTCTIHNNWSRRGGGLNVFVMNLPGWFANSTLQINDVLFIANRGLSSAAVRFDTALPLGNPISVIPEFINCKIRDHKATYWSYTSAFTSQRVSVRFSGRNVFRKNLVAGAVEHQGGVIYVHGQLKFIGNSGSKGGAVLLRSSQIILNPGSELSFIRNFAAGVGGAMLVLTSSMYEFIHANNPDCFLAYSETQTPPSKWKVR